MTEEKTRIGIIGVGQIGKGHVRTYMGMPHVEIAAVADVNEAEAQPGGGRKRHCQRLH